MRSWEELSQINFGLIIRDLKTPQMYVSDEMFPPYDEAIEWLQKNKTKTHKDCVAKGILSSQAHHRAEIAAKSLNGLGGDEELEWADELKKAYKNYNLGKTLKKAGLKLEGNENADLIKLYGEISSIVANQATGLTLARDIDYSNYKPFIKCGWKVIDDIIGGIPADGPIVVYGKTGVGKSHFLSKMAISLLQQYRDWTAAIYTLEMSAEHWMWRESQMYPILGKLSDRLYVSGSVRNIDELIAEITTKRVNFVGIDDVDGIVNEQSAVEYERNYRKIKEICRFLKIPVMPLAQPNRQAKLSGRFLTQYDIAWSGAAENSAALLIALQKANSLELEQGADCYPVFDDDNYYMIFGKSRDGWPKQQGPGAIVLSKSKALWEGDAYRNRLWVAGAMETIGKKKGKR